MIGVDAISAVGDGVGRAGLGQIPMMTVMPTMRDEAVAAAADADPTGFETMMTRAINGLSDTLRTSDRMSELAATGQLADPTTAILAAEEADLAMTMAVQVRNRLLTAWNTLNQMSV